MFCRLQLIFFLAGITFSLASPGRLDSSFTPTPPPNGKIHAIHIHPDGGIIVGGEFTEPKAYLAKYDANGILDSTFSPSLDGPVYALETINTFDLILVGGSFENLNSTPSRNFGGIKLDGTPHPNSKYICGSSFDGPVHTIRFNYDILGLLVGGEFSSFQGIPASNLAGFETNSSSQSITFRTDYLLNGKVNTIASPRSRPDSSFGVYVGGTFTTANANSVQNCAFITETSATKSFFDIPSETFSIQPYSEYLTAPLKFVIVGGAFTTLPSSTGPVPALGIGLLNESGEPASDFPPNNFTNATTIFLDSGKEFLAGSNNGDLWRFSVSDPPSSPANPTAVTTTSFYYPSLTNGKIASIEEEAFGRYYIIGDFTEVDGKSRPYFARLHGAIYGSGPPDPPSISSEVTADDGAFFKIPAERSYLAYQIQYRSHDGAHWHLQPEIEAPGAYLTGLLPDQAYEVRARVKNFNGWSDWGAITSFQSKAQLGDIGLPLPPSFLSHPVNGSEGGTLHFDSNGNLLLRGSFQDGEETNFGIVSISPTFEVSLFYRDIGSPSLVDFRPDPRGGVIARTESSDFIRIDENGEIDPSYNSEPVPETWDGGFGVQSDGKVILVDTSGKNNAESFISLARLNADGSRDINFNPVFREEGFIPWIGRLLLLPDDSIFALGNFNKVDGIPTRAIVKLDPEGRRDSSFQFDPGSEFWAIYDVSIDSTGRLLVAGGPQGGSDDKEVDLRRLTASGDTDPTFPELVFPRSIARAIGLQADGKIIVSAALFANTLEINGVPVGETFRLTPDGEVDPTFNQGLGLLIDPSYTSPSFRPSIRSIKSLPDGTIAVSGIFDRCNGIPCNNFALLRGDGAPSNYELWLKAHGLPPESDSTTNLDGDPFNLAFEFAYNLSPLRNDSTIFLQTTGASARITPPLQRGVSVSAHFSPDLQTWQEITPNSDWTLEPPSGFEGLEGYFHFSIDSVDCRANSL